MAGMPSGSGDLHLLAGELAAPHPYCRLDRKRRALPLSRLARTVPAVVHAGASGRPGHNPPAGLPAPVDSPGPPECVDAVSLFAEQPRGRYLQDTSGLHAPAYRTPLTLPPGMDPRTVALLRDQAPELMELAQYGYFQAALSKPIEWQGFQGILRTIADFTDMEVVELFLVDWQNGAMLLTEHYGPRENAFRQITDFMPWQGYPGLVAASRQPLITSDLPSDARFLRTRVKDVGFTECICIPLFGPRNVQGAIGVASRRSHADLDAIAGILGRLSQPLGAALSSAMLDARDSVADVPLEAAPDPLSSLESLIGYALDRMLAVSGASSASVTLRDPASGNDPLRVQRGVVSGAVGGSPVSCGTALCPASQGLRTIAHDGLRRALPEVCRVRQAAEGPALCLPLVAGGVSLGVVTLHFPAAAATPVTKYAGVLSAMASRAAALVSGQFAWQKMWQAALSTRREAPPRTVETATAPGPVRPQDSASGDAGLSCRPDPEAVLSIRCFGDFHVFRNGAPLAARAFVRRQARTALKVLLARAGQKVPKDVLVECLWPDDISGNGVERLHVVMNALRKTLEPEGKSPWLFVQTDGDAYFWNTDAPYRLDLQEFGDCIREAEILAREGRLDEALTFYQAAARLYRGDFMNDEPYSDWCGQQRERYREQYLTLMRTIAQLLERRGDLAGAARTCQRALETDPLREEVLLELMRYLWKTGRRDEALRQYTVFRNRLRQELEADPLAETRTLFQQIAGGSVLYP